MREALKKLHPYLDKPTADAVDVYKRLVDLTKAEGESIASRAFAGAMAPQLAMDFVRANGLTESKGNLCIQRLVGKRCRLGDFRGGNQGRCTCYPPADDHPSMWGKDGKPAFWVSQPYTLNLEALQAIGAFCEELRLAIAIETWPSWHFPGHALSVIYWRREARAYRSYLR